MNQDRLWALVVLLLCLSTAVAQAFAQDVSDGRVDTSPRERTWLIDGVAREAVIALPATAKTKPAPLVFLFHGHGGKMRQVFQMYSMQRRWPDAIVVSPQGLNTPGTLTDLEGKKSGWQSLPGQQGDRDLRFFDAMLASMKQDYQIDERRIYATGHSNGAAFTYLLWGTRGDILTAVAPSAGAIRPELQALLTPKPAMIVAGEQDRLVKFQWQAASIEFVRKLNRCSEEPITSGFLHSYPSKIDAPVWAYIYPGAHRFYVDAAPTIVEFFQDQSKSSDSRSSGSPSSGSPSSGSRDVD